MTDEELDRQVAEKIMGWTSLDCEDCDGPCFDIRGGTKEDHAKYEWTGYHDFNPSTYIADAMRVLEHIRKTAKFGVSDITISMHPDYKDEDEIMAHRGIIDDEDDWGVEITQGDTNSPRGAWNPETKLGCTYSIGIGRLPRAICLAALKAVKEEDNE